MEEGVVKLFATHMRKIIPKERKIFSSGLNTFYKSFGW
jgi:hypothetical protein